MPSFARPAGLILTVTAVAGCAASTSQTAADSLSALRPQYASTYTRRPGPAVLIRNATILTAAGPELRWASILFLEGKIVAVGTEVSAPAGTSVVDGSGKFVTPGIIDAHSHLGVYPAPSTPSIV